MVLCTCLLFFISMVVVFLFFFFFSSRRRHTRWNCDWSSDVCSSDLVVEIPESGSLDARTIKHVIGLAVRVEIGRSDQSIAAGNGRPECASDERGAGQGPEHRLARACTVKEIIGFVIAIEVCHTDHSPVNRQSWS